MKITILLLLLINMNNLFAQTFLENQKKHLRVKEAYQEKQTSVETLLMSANLSLTDISLYIRIFKQEQLLEVWGKKKKDTSYKLITTYPLCATSGKPGPKRMQGDEQMPEGVYKVVQFNPLSNFHLSIKIDYPNASDLKLTTARNPGNDIFIHGNCVTIGCFPIGDDAIKELYILAIEATSQNQLPIPVHIFPCKMNEKNMKQLITIYPQHEEFWKSLQPVYEYFEQTKKLATIRINAKGYYEIVH